MSLFNWEIVPLTSGTKFKTPDTNWGYRSEITYKTPAELVKELSNDTKVPRSDVISTATEVVVKIDVPGYKRENLEITVKNQDLVVKGTREKETVKPLVNERVLTSFERSYSLGSTTDLSTVVAALADGVLTVTVQKKQATSTKIEIK